MNEEINTTNLLAKEYSFIGLLKFTFPSMIMMVIMGLYTIVDTIFVSNLVNTDALSAINIVCPVINIIVGVGAMLSTGGSAIIARKMGEGKNKEARQNFTLIIIVGILLGVGITCLGILFLDSILWGLGASEVLYPYCKDYLLILLLFIPASMLQMLFQNLIVTAGRPAFGMILSIGAGAANIALDYLFMVPLNMGIRGSALGTGIGYLIPAVIGLYFFTRNKEGLHFEKPQLDGKLLLESCLNGSSEMVSQAAAAVTTFLFNSIMMRLLGENGVAAITIIIYTQFLLMTLYIGFSMGAAPMISYNYGSQNHDQLKRMVKMCLSFILGTSVLVFIFAQFFTSGLVGLFSDQASIVYLYARHGFSIFSYSFLFCGLNIYSSALFTALSNGKISAVISFLRTFGLITAALLILPALIGVNGVWLAVPLAEGVTMLLAGGLLLGYRKRYCYL